MSSSASIDYHVRSSKLCPLCPVIQTSSMLWLWKKPSLTWPGQTGRKDPAGHDQFKPGPKLVVVTTGKQVRLFTKSLPLDLSLLACLRNRSQRSSKTGSNPWASTSYGTSRVATTYTWTTSPLRMRFYRSRLVWSYWNYGNNKAVWSEAFFNFMTIIVVLFVFNISTPFTLVLSIFTVKFLTSPRFTNGKEEFYI